MRCVFVRHRSGLACIVSTHALLLRHTPSILVQESGQVLAPNTFISIIIRKEQDVLDKEIFWEFLVDRLEENCQEANFERVEAKQKWDNKEKARLLREEVQRVVDREMDHLRQEAANRARI